MSVKVELQQRLPHYEPNETSKLADQVGIGEPTESIEKRLELIKSKVQPLEHYQSQPLRWYYDQTTRPDHWERVHAPEELVSYIFHISECRLFDELEFRHTYLQGKESWVLIGLHKGLQSRTDFILAQWGEHIPVLSSIVEAHEEYLRIREAAKRLQSMEDKLFVLSVASFIIGFCVVLASIVVGLVFIVCCAISIRSAAVKGNRAKRSYRDADRDARKLIRQVTQEAAAV